MAWLVVKETASLHFLSGWGGLASGWRLCPPGSMLVPFAYTQVPEGKCLGQSIQDAQASGPFWRAVPTLRVMRRGVWRWALQLFLENSGNFFATQKGWACPAWASSCPNHLSLHQHMPPWGELRHRSPASSASLFSVILGPEAALPGHLLEELEDLPCE